MTMKRKQIIYFSVLLADIAVFIATNSLPPLAVAAVIIVLPIVSQIYLRIFVATLSISCHVDTRTSVGKDIPLTIHFKTPVTVFPGTVFIRYSFINSLFGVEDRTTVIWDAGVRNPDITVPYSNFLCGNSYIIIDNISVRDSLRFFEHKKKFSFSGNIQIFPAEVDMNIVYSSVVQNERDGKLYEATKRGTDRSEPFEIRNYVPGDNKKNIHWKLSSKLDKLVIREPSRPNNSETLVLCDLSLKTRNITISPKTVTDRISITIAISKNLLRQGIRHSVCLLGADINKLFVVENTSDLFRLSNILMNLHLKNEVFNSADALTQLDIISEFSKLIYITDIHEHEGLKILADIIDITIITTSPGRNIVSQMMGSIKIFSLGEDELYNSSYQISV